VQVKGSVLAARVAYLESLGPELSALVRERLSPGLRERIDAKILPNVWVSLREVNELTRVIDEVSGTGDGRRAEEAGRFACDANLTTLYRAFFRLGNIGFIIKRAAAAWRVHYDFGDMQVVSSERKRVHLRLAGVPEPDESHCRAVMGWMVRAGELTGCKDVARKVLACRTGGAPACEWELTWR
jgi:hypothetical protein